jgi:branched-chain amino acid transport system permease protein
VTGWVHVRSALGALTLFVILAALGLTYAARSGAADRLVTVVLIQVIMVVGLQVFVGNTGVLSFGHASFAAVAAYTTAILTAPALVKEFAIPDAPFGVARVELPMWLGAVAGVAMAVAVAALVGLAVRRLSGISAAIVTLAMLIVLHSILVNWVSLTNGAEAFYGIPAVTGKGIVLGADLVAIVVARLFLDSHLGLQAQASREDEVAAASMGIDVARVRLAAWVISAALVGVGGILLAHFLGAINPQGFYFDLTFLLLAMLLLGGMRSVTGAVLGTVVVTIGSELTRFLGDGPELLGIDLPPLFGLSPLFLGAVIIIVMILRPGGLVGDREIDHLVNRFRRVEPRPAEDEEPRDLVSHHDEDGRSRWLRVKEVSKLFEGLAAVDGVSMRVERGEIVGLIGPNGAGKTTVLNTISALVSPTGGRVELGDRVLSGMEVAGVARAGVARTFQNIRLFSELTVLQNVEVSAIAARRYRPKAAGLPTPRLLDEFGLEEVAERKASTLPFGSQRRVEVARAVALAPDFLLLDEPAAGMNEHESAQLLGVIRHIRDLQGCGVVVVDHDLSFIMNVCERIYVLNHGKLIAHGTPEEVQSDPQVRLAYLGTGAAPPQSPDVPRSVGGSDV